MSKLAHSNSETMAQIERNANDGRPTEPSTAGHLSNCAVHEYESCTCGAASKRTEAEARADIFRALKPFVIEAGFLCATGPNGVRFPMYSMDLIVGEEREDRATQKLIVEACNSHADITGFIDLVANLLLNGEDNGDQGQYEQEPDDAIETMESLVTRARALRANLTGAV